MSSKPFGKIRNILWPIEADECKKVIPMLLLFFLVSFVYHLLRNMKIALVVTLKNSGANTIPFLKIFCVLPCAIIATYIFAKLVTKYNRDKVFYMMIGGFLGYFALFTFVLFPNEHVLELNIIADFLKQNIFIASGFDGLIAVIRYWNISLFYVMQELWSTVAISMLLWGFANEITQMHEAKRFYVIFAIATNSAGIFMGSFANWLTQQQLPNISFYLNSYQWVFYELLLVMIITSCIIGIFYYINHYVIEHDPTAQLHVKTRPKVSIAESITFLRQSKYLVYLVFIVLSYNIAWNLTDVIWTYRATVAYPDSQQLNYYMNYVTFITGIIAVLGGFLSIIIIRRKGWKFSAMVTPTIWLITGMLFYSSILMEHIFTLGIFYNIIANPANLILLLGTIQISLGRGCKYTIFDATKEMIFIPLTKHEKRKSKAVVDGIASRLGKSMGSILFIVLLLIFNDDIAATIPYVFVGVMLLLLLWTYSIQQLDRTIPKLHESTTTNPPKPFKQKITNFVQ